MKQGVATVADVWRPTSELERRLVEAVRAGDREGYFRALATAELLFPVAPDLVDDVLANRVQPPWPTRDDDGRVHVLAFTSPAAMLACLGPAVRHFLTLSFADVARNWPEPRWWLAVDAVSPGLPDAPPLPVEGRLPSWFVRQVADGDALPPLAGRPELLTPVPPGARHAAPEPYAPDAPAAPAAPEGERAPWTPPGEAPAFDRAPEGDPREETAPPTSRDPYPSAPEARPAAEDERPAPAGYPGDARPRVPQGDALDDVAPPSAAPPNFDSVAPPQEPIAPAAQEPVAPPSVDSGAPPHEPLAPPAPDSGAPPQEPVAPPAPDLVAPPHEPVAPAVPDSGARQEPAASPTPDLVAPPHVPVAPAVPDSGARQEPAAPPAPDFVAPPQESVAPPAVDSGAPPHESVASAADDSGARPQESAPDLVAPPQEPSAPPAVLETAAPSAQEPGAPPQEPVAAPGSGADASGTPPFGRPAGPAPDETQLDLPVVADDEPWEELRERAPARSRPFEPANDVERDLLRAASANDHDLFLRTLVDAEVLLPVPDDVDYALRPGRPGFPWPTRDIDGTATVPVFTSPERLVEAARDAGTGSAYMPLPFTAVLRYWPDSARPLAVNSGSPAGGTIHAGQLPGLATWADQRAARRLAEAFEPQNEVEEKLFEASRRGDTEAFFQILTGAQVLVPAEPQTPWGIPPEDPDFPWRPVPVHGRTSIQVFTSLRWMSEAIGSSRFVMPSFAEMAAAWPDESWTLVLNPGTPVDAVLPADRVRALAGRATAPEPAPDAPSPAPGAIPVPDAPSAPDAIPTPDVQIPPSTPDAPVPPSMPDAQIPPSMPDAPSLPPAPDAVPTSNAQGAPPEPSTAPVPDASVESRPPLADAPAVPGASTPPLPGAGGTPPAPDAPSAPSADSATVGAPDAGGPPRRGMDEPVLAAPDARGTAAAESHSAAFEPGNRIDQELYEAVRSGDSDAFLRVLLAANVLVPIPDDAPLEVTPVQREFRWDAALRDAVSVRVFTSLVRLREVLPESRFVYADFRELIAAWPRPDWAMLLNPGTRIGASLEGEQVRALSAWAVRVGLVRSRPEIPPLPEPPRPPAPYAESAPRPLPSRPEHARVGTRPAPRPAPQEQSGTRPAEQSGPHAQPGTPPAPQERSGPHALPAPEEQHAQQDQSGPHAQPAPGLVPEPAPEPDAAREPVAVPENGLQHGLQHGLDRRPEPGHDVRSDGGPRPEPVPADAPAARPAPPEPEGEPVPQPSIMQKVVPHGHVGWYLEQGYDRVGGFVHPTSDVAELQTPAQLYETLGLLYPDSPFAPSDEGVYVIRWPAYCAELYRVPFGGRSEEELASWGDAGWVLEAAPFQGTGFAPGSAGSIREYKVDSVRLPYGAEMYLLGADRTERFVAMYDPDRLAWLRPEAGEPGGERR